jgi:hypothetical protein
MLQLSNYLKNNDNEWREIKTQAGYHNPWFTEEFIDLAVKNITNELLIKEKLIDWINFYHLDDLIQPKKIGIIMAGNIPLVGFHDFLSVFISGHLQLIKLSFILSGIIAISLLFKKNLCISPIYIYNKKFITNLIKFLI